MGKFDNYEFRCSALGKIASKSGKLTDANKTYLQELFIGEIYGTKREAYGKALDKGVFCEEDGITMIGQTLLRGQLIVKNKERKYNGWIHGECDVFKNSTVYDVKNALTLFSFGKASLTWDYEWQLVGYAWLWNAKKAILYYCLNNMPDHMVEDEKRALFYKNKWKYLTEESPNYIEDCKALEEAHNYDNMPLEEKFKFWEVDLSNERIESLKASITASRHYLNKLYNNHIKMIQSNRESMGLPSILTAHHDKEVNSTIVE